MRLRKAAVLTFAAALVAGGCSRLTFIRPDASKSTYTEVAQPVTVRETPASRQRSEARNQLLVAQTQLVQGDLEAAEAAAHRALKLTGDSADAYTLLAVIAERRGRQEEAGAAYQRAAALAPDAGGPANNLGTWLCGTGRAAESLAWFDRALADPRYQTPAVARANAGACALQAGQLGRAGRDLRAAVELDADNAVALGALARLEYQAGHYLDARAFSERRLAAAPADAAALRLASQIEQKLGDTAAAARYGLRLREEFPASATGGSGDTTQR